jgi:hypothetical protein
MVLSVDVNKKCGLSACLQLFFFGGAFWQDTCGGNSATTPVKERR